MTEVPGLSGSNARTSVPVSREEASPKPAYRAGREDAPDSIGKFSMPASIAVFTVTMAVAGACSKGKSMVQAEKIPEKGWRSGRSFHSDDPLRYSGVIEWLLRREESFIGASYYYIREERGCYAVCRMSITGGCLYAVGTIDHMDYGITVEDIGDAVRGSGNVPELPGHYHIDSRIGEKLRTFLEPDRRSGEPDRQEPVPRILQVIRSS